METRLRELQEMVEEKRRDRQRKQEARYNQKVTELENTLQQMDAEPEDDFAEFNKPGAARAPRGPPAAPPNSAEFESWMQKIVEDRINKLDAQFRQREEDLRQREIQLKQQQDAYNNVSNKNITDASGNLDIAAILAQLNRINQIEENITNLKKDVSDVKTKATFGGGPSGGDSNLTAEEIMNQIKEAQAIIFNDNSTEKQIAEANINLEKLMQQYEQTPECRAAKEEKRQANEKLNKAALERVRAALKSLNEQDRKQRFTDNPELKLMFLEPQAILKLHQNDFKMFAIRGLTAEELRALRGCLPTFRKDQRVQLDWVDSIEGKIEELGSSEAKPPPPPKAAKKPGLSKP